MPVRLLNSSVLAWPDAQAVVRELRRWTQEQVSLHPELLRLGYFGSYARGDWGFGSDLDLIAVIDSTGDPFERRAARWEVAELPVPAEILVYTSAEWTALPPESRFARTLAREAVWVYTRDPTVQESGS